MITKDLYAGIGAHDWGQVLLTFSDGLICQHYEDIIDVCDSYKDADDECSLRYLLDRILTLRSARTETGQLPHYAHDRLRRSRERLIKFVAARPAIADREVSQSPAGDGVASLMSSSG